MSNSPRTPRLRSSSALLSSPKPSLNINNLNLSRQDTYDYSTYGISPSTPRNSVGVGWQKDKRSSLPSLSSPRDYQDADRISPRQCDICGQIRHTVLCSPRNSPILPGLSRKCIDCIDVKTEVVK